MNWSWRDYTYIVFIDISYYLKKKDGINQKYVMNISILRKKSKDFTNNKNN